MRMKAILMAVGVLVLAGAAPALAQSNGSSSDNSSSSGAGGSSTSGGSSESSASIHVSGGGAVGVTQGSVAGGSSASGSSSSGASNEGPSTSGASDGSTADAPSATTGGVVNTNLHLPTVDLDSTPTADNGMNVLTWVGIALIAAGGFLLYRRLPRGRTA